MKFPHALVMQFWTLAQSLLYKRHNTMQYNTMQKCPTCLSCLFFAIMTSSFSAKSPSFSNWNNFISVHINGHQCTSVTVSWRRFHGCGRCYIQR